MLLAARSQLALDKGNIEEAVALAERYLRSVPDTNFTERIEVLEVVTRARLATGDLPKARAAAAELSTIAERIGTPALRAIGFLSQGLTSRGEDILVAQSSFERAMDLFDAAGMPYEGAIARKELAETHLSMGLEGLARDGLLEAHSTLSSLGAAVAAARIADLLDGLGVNGSEPRHDDPLTPREREVIQLVAKGLTNDEIADSLVLSVRTVERHISNLYAKIGAYGRAARAVATAYAHSNGLAD
jgi:ATP/maltotriose-dependent transcriptional regulator MalT